MGVKIRKHLVSPAIAKRVTYGGTNPKKYIVIHETANLSRGANANAHGRLQASGNSRSASWHYTVDDKEIVQSFADSAQCWHAGNAKYNRESIGIEICVNAGGDFKKAVENAAALARQLSIKYGIPAANIIQHNTASGKDCPRYLRSGSKGVNWAEFKRMVSGGAKVSNPKKTAVKPVKTTNKGAYKGGSIVEYLNSIGIDSSFNNRKKLASKYGIKNYSGTAAQNMRLLSIMRDGKVVGKAAKPSVKYPLPSGVLRRGSKGSAVKQLQRALNAANFKVGAVDGIYGAKTEDAVRRFQSVYDAYNVDGVYGNRTRDRLNKIIN